MDLASLQNEVRQQKLPPLVTGWPNEDLFKLFEMYGDRCSLETMALHFGKTKGQISGILHRASIKGLVKRHAPRQKAAPAPPKPKPIIAPFNVAGLVKRVVKAKSKKRRFRLRLITDENQVTFADLEPHHCRWPSGDPRRSDFRFCGCRRVIGKPYCEDHTVMAGRLYSEQRKPQNAGSAARR